VKGNALFTVSRGFKGQLPARKGKGEKDLVAPQKKKTAPETKKRSQKSDRTKEDT